MQRISIQEAKKEFENGQAIWVKKAEESNAEMNAMAEDFGDKVEQLHAYEEFYI